MDALNCREFVELVTGYMEGHISAVDRERMEAHLPTCRGCRNYLAHLRHTVELVSQLPNPPLPLEARREFLTLFRQWQASL